MNSRRIVTAALVLATQGCTSGTSLLSGSGVSYEFSHSPEGCTATIHKSAGDYALSGGNIKISSTPSGCKVSGGIEGTASTGKESDIPDAVGGAVGVVGSVL